jgi:hypothetical protein
MDTPARQDDEIPDVMFRSLESGELYYPLTWDGVAYLRSKPNRFSEVTSEVESFAAAIVRSRKEAAI